MSLVPAAAASLRLRCPGGGCGGREGACSSLSCHIPGIPRKALFRAKISQVTLLEFNQYCIIKCGRCDAKEEKRHHTSCGHPSSWLRLFTTVYLYSAATCFPPHSSPIILTSPCWFGLCGFSPSALTGTAGHGLK